MPDPLARLEVMLDRLDAGLPQRPGREIGGPAERPIATLLSRVAGGGRLTGFRLRLLGLERQAVGPEDLETRRGGRVVVQEVGELVGRGPGGLATWNARSFLNVSSSSYDMHVSSSSYMGT